MATAQGMKAIQLTAYGAPGAYRDALRGAEDVAVPTPAKHQIRVKVTHASLHAGDLRVADGVTAKLMPLRFPATVGAHFAGIVDLVPDNAPAEVRQKFKRGDRVAGIGGVLEGGTGTFAEYCCAPAASCGLVPDTVALDTAAALPTTAAVAYQGFAKINLNEANAADKALLVLGGCTGTGLGMLALAKAYGVKEIVCTAGAGSEKLAKNAGAVEVVDYRQGDWAEALAARRFDFIINTVEPVSAWVKSQRLLKKGGTYMTLCFDDAVPTAPITMAQVLAQGCRVVCRKLWSFVGYPNYILLIVDEKSARGLDQFLKMTAEGRCPTFVSPASPFAFTVDGVAQMHEAQARGSVRGRHVVEVSRAVAIVPEAAG